MPPPPPPPPNPYGQPSAPGAWSPGVPAGYGVPGGPQGYYPGQDAYSALEKRSTTVLVLGILSLVICGILGPIAWSMGNNIKKEAAAMGRDEPSNSKGGRICGIIATCLMALGVVILVVLVILAAVGSRTSTG
jgi:hypothetical protein